MTKSFNILIFMLLSGTFATAQNYLVIEDTLTLNQYRIREKSDMELSLIKQPELGFISGDAKFGSVGIKNSAEDLIYWNEIDRIRFKPKAKRTRIVFFTTLGVAGVTAVVAYILTTNKKNSLTLELAPFGMIVSAFTAAGISNMLTKTEEVKMFDPAYRWYIQKYNKGTKSWESYSVMQ